MYLLLDACNDFDVLKLVLFSKSLLNVIRFLIPIILIITITIDIVKIVMNTKEKNNKSFKSITNRLMVAILIFFSITIVDITMKTVGNAGLESNACWNGATIENIKKLEDIYKEELAKKKAAEEAARSVPVTTPVNYTETGVGGTVSVRNGVFYIPKNGTSGLPDTRGTGTNGLNIYFDQRLDKMIADAANAGYKIGITDYWRSYESQVSCKIRKPNLCTTPGKSMHGWGIAADLNYYNSKAATDWAHRNAANYDLEFNVCKDYFGGVCKEPWHIQPISIVKE